MHLHDTFAVTKDEAVKLEREALLARKLLVAQEAGKAIAMAKLLQDKVSKLSLRSSEVKKEEDVVEKQIKADTASLQKMQQVTSRAKAAADKANAKVISPHFNPAPTPKTNCSHSSNVTTFSIF